MELTSSNGFRGHRVFLDNIRQTEVIFIMVT